MSNKEKGSEIWNQNMSICSTEIALKSERKFWFVRLRQLETGSKTWSKTGSTTVQTGSKTFQTSSRYKQAPENVTFLLRNTSCLIETSVFIPKQTFWKVHIPVYNWLWRQFYSSLGGFRNVKLLNEVTKFQELEVKNYNFT